MLNIRKGMYILQEGNSNRYKFGYSEDIDSKINEAQLGNLNEIILTDHYLVNNVIKNIIEIEKNLINKYNFVKTQDDCVILSVSNLVRICRIMITYIIIVDIKLPNNQVIQIPNNYKCNYCRNIYSSEGGLSNHKRKCDAFREIRHDIYYCITQDILPQIKFF